MMRHDFQALLLTATMWTFSACSTEIGIFEDADTPSVHVPDNGFGGGEPQNGRFTAQSTVSDVAGDPAFGDFGRLLFPVDRNVSPSMTLAQVSTSSVYMWYPYIRVEKTVEILNYLHSESAGGRQIFYHIYSPGEMAADRSKADTGIFVFRGNQVGPYAIVNAGGGFAYVGAMHDSFPHSLELSRAGYTTFALIYRPDDPYRDLARDQIYQ